MADQPMEVEENAAPPTTVKALLESCGFKDDDANVVSAVKEISGGDRFYSDASRGLMGLEGCKSPEALAESLNGHGVHEFLAGGVARALWTELVKWDPWKDRAFDPVSQIMCCCVPRALFALSVVTASTCRLCPRVCCRVVNFRGRREGPR